MKNVATTLGEHHRLCDALYAQCEVAVQDGRWADAAEQHDRFRRESEGHWSVEETILFPAIEQATGNRLGPTEVMRIEHAKMRRILPALADAIARERADVHDELGETLLILIQQHNIKEENILYPMCDRICEGEARELVARLEAGLAQPS